MSENCACANPGCIVHPSDYECRNRATHLVCNVVDASDPEELDQLCEGCARNMIDTTDGLIMVDLGVQIPANEPANPENAAELKELFLSTIDDRLDILRLDDDSRDMVLTTEIDDQIAHWEALRAKVEGYEV